MWQVQQQTIEEPACGLTLQFEVMPDGSPRLRLFGEALPFGNREIVFDAAGLCAGGGSYTAPCKPTWMEKLGD